MLSLLGHAIFFGFLVLCVGGLLFGLPGTFLILGGAVLYAFLTGFSVIGVKMLVGLGLFTVMGEAAEYLLGVAGARRYGSSGRGIVFSMIGGGGGGPGRGPFSFRRGGRPGCLGGRLSGCGAR